MTACRNPKIRRAPPNVTSWTVRDWPGSKRTAEPAGTSRRMPRASSRGKASAGFTSKKW